MADDFEIRVECEVATLHEPEARNAFESWCAQRMATECAENDGYFVPELMTRNRLARDPEGPGRAMQPFLLRHPFLPVKRNIFSRIWRRLFG